MIISSDERLWEQWEWRDYFPEGMEKQGEELYQKGVGEILVEEGQKGGSLEIRKFHITAQNLPSTYEECVRSDPFLSLHKYVRCDCAAYQKSKKCKHMYVFLRKWEDTVSSFRKDESLEKYEERMKEASRKRRENPMAPLFADLSVNTQCYLTPWEALATPLHARPGDMEEASEALSKEEGPEVTISLERDSFYEKLRVTASMAEEGSKAEMSLRHTEEVGEIELTTSCSCSRSENFYYHSRICIHQLILLHHLWEYVLRVNPTEESIMGQVQEEEMNEAVKNASLFQKEVKAILGGKAVPRKENLCSLLPEIKLADSEIRLSFRLKLPGGKSYALRNLPNFMEAYRGKEELELSMATSVDFSLVRLDEESLSYFRYIYINMESMRMLTDMVNSSYSGYYGQSHWTSFEYISYVPVDFDTVDAFYELAEGRDLTLAGTKERFHVGGDLGKIDYVVSPVKDASGNVAEREAKIEEYQIVEGFVHTYLFLPSRLCRLTREEEGILERLRERELDEMTIAKEQYDAWESKILPILQNVSLLNIIMQE